MIKKLSRSGNSLALVIDRPLLEQLQIDGDTELEVSTDGHVIVISPVRSKKRRARIKELADETLARYAGVFAKL